MKSTYLVIAAAALAASATLCPGDEPAGPKPDELFGQLDKNKDGNVAADEVGDDHKPLFNRLVRRGDKNDDGMLSKDEFLQASKDQPAKGDQRQGGRGGRRGLGMAPGIDPGKVFDNLDTNKDGKLTLDELPEQARERMSAMFEKAGKEDLSKDEYVKFAGERRKRFEARAAENGPADGEEMPEGDGPPPKAGKRGDGGPPGDGANDGPGGRRRMQGGMRGGRGPGVPKLIQLLDTDNDRKISKDELSKAADLFEKLDLNKDGSLDMQELGAGPGPGEGGPGGGGGPRERFRGRRPGGPRDGGPGPGGPQDGRPQDGGPREGGPGPDGGPGPGDNPPPRDGAPQDGDSES